MSRVLGGGSCFVKNEDDNGALKGILKMKNVSASFKTQARVGFNLDVVQKDYHKDAEPNLFASEQHLVLKSAAPEFVGPLNTQQARNSHLREICNRSNLKSFFREELADRGLSVKKLMASEVVTQDEKEKINTAFKAATFRIIDAAVFDDDDLDMAHEPQFLEFNEALSPFYKDSFSEEDKSFFPEIFPEHAPNRNERTAKRSRLSYGLGD
jgi:hypothetical protein